MTEAEKKAFEIAKFAHEQEAMRQERTIKRLWILCIILIALLVASNAGWMIYEAQFEEYVETTEIDAEQSGDNNNIIGGDYYGSAGPYNQDYKAQGEEDW